MAQAPLSLFHKPVPLGFRGDVFCKSAGGGSRRAGFRWSSICGTRSDVPDKARKPGRVALGSERISSFMTRYLPNFGFDRSHQPFQGHSAPNTFRARQTPLPFQISHESPLESRSDKQTEGRAEFRNARSLWISPNFAVRLRQSTLPTGILISAFAQSRTQSATERLRFLE